MRTSKAALFHICIDWILISIAFSTTSELRLQTPPPSPPAQLNLARFARVRLTSKWKGSQDWERFELSLAFPSEYNNIH